MDRTRKLMLVLAAVATVIAAYLVSVHYAPVPLYCPTSGIINCENVLTSAYSVLFGVPLAVYAVVFFVIEIIVVLLDKKTALTLMNAVGVGVVVYTIDLERIIGNICLYCTILHIIIITLLVLSIINLRKKQM